MGNPEHMKRGKYEWVSNFIFFFLPLMFRIVNIMDA